jgi:UDP-N-acetylmuramate-alanine ligase
VQLSTVAKALKKEAGKTSIKFPLNKYIAEEYNLLVYNYDALAGIYAAREQNTYGISSKDILDLLLEKGVNAHYFPSFEEIEKFLSENCVNGDLLITMGAGNVVEIGEDLLKK